MENCQRHTLNLLENTTSRSSVTKIPDETIAWSMKLVAIVEFKDRTPIRQDDEVCTFLHTTHGLREHSCGQGDARDRQLQGLMLKVNRRTSRLMKPTTDTVLWAIHNATETPFLPPNNTCEISIDV